jgi:CHASE3 domain sensor protein
VLFLCSLVQDVEHAYHSFADLDTRSADVTLMRLNSALTHAESSVRGYVVTGNEHWLARFYRSAPRVANRRRELLEHVNVDRSTDHHDYELATQVTSAAEVRMQVIEEILQIRRKSGFEAARTSMIQHDSEALMETFSDRVHTLLLRIRSLHADRNASTNQYFSTVWVTAIIETVFLFIAACVCFVIGRFGFNHEMIERNEALQHLLQKAEEATQLKSTLLQNISHELLTPMNGHRRTEHNTA